MTCEMKLNFTFVIHTTVAKTVLLRYYYSPTNKQNTPGKVMRVSL